MLRFTARRLIRNTGQTDAEIVQLMKDKKISFYNVENFLKPDYTRAVAVRRQFVQQYIAPLNDEKKNHALDHVPFEGYGWDKVAGSNCENVVGYLPIPVGLAGPIKLDGVEYPIPMATTEGALVASTHRGARAINESSVDGVVTAVLNEGMTRAPVVEVPSLKVAAELRQYCIDNFADIKAAFESTTRFGKLTELRVALTGRKAYLRFRAATGDAMGMNMITKGVDKALNLIQSKFPEMKILALSGNLCTDKKPSAVNWIEGRGRHVVAEAIIKKEYVHTTLKTTVPAMVQLNVDKNYIGSALAGSVGGFNAQSANVVAAVFLATGQDPAQVVESSTCLTTMDATPDGDLAISVMMPSIETGTVGGGTTLPAQKGFLELIGCAGAHREKPGKNAELLSRVVAGGVLAAELSLMAGLAAGHLLRAHMSLNRKPTGPATPTEK